MPTETIESKPCVEAWALDAEEHIASTRARIAQAKRTIATSVERIAESREALATARKRLEQPVG